MWDWNRFAHFCVSVVQDLDGNNALKPHRSLAQVSSVQLHVETGDLLKESDFIALFEFGGSDIVIVLQASAVVYIIGAPNQK